MSGNLEYLYLLSHDTNYLENVLVHIRIKGEVGAVKLV